MKKGLCFLILLVMGFSAFAEIDMRLFTGIGPRFNIVDYDYYDEGYKREQGFEPTFLAPTFLIGFPNKSFVTPLVGIGGGSVLFLSVLSATAGVSLELPKFAYFSHEFLILASFNYYLFLLMGVSTDWTLTVDVPYMFSFPSKKGLYFGLGPKFRFHQDGNYSHGHEYDIGVLGYIGARW